MNNFKDWLIFYNNLDVLPLAKAIENSFKNFFEIFKIDPEWCISLPKYAQMCMFSHYDPESPYCYSFCPKNSEIRKLFRSNLLGGLVNCFHRLIDLSGRPGLPKAAQYAPNGDRFTNCTFLDFNSLYLYSQLLPFPGTPGILWQKRQNYFQKTVMTQGASLEGLQWLLFENEKSPHLILENGARAKIQHKFFRGEKKFAGFEIDGFAEISGVKYFWEYLGCWFHTCEKCGSEGKPGSRERWERKKSILKQNGRLIIMRGCTWKKKNEVFTKI